MSIPPEVMYQPLTDARRRVTEFLDARSKMRGIDHSEVMSLNVGPGGEGQYLLVADLRALSRAEPLTELQIEMDVWPRLRNNGSFLTLHECLTVFHTMRQVQGDEA